MRGAEIWAEPASGNSPDGDNDDPSSSNSGSDSENGQPGADNNPPTNDTPVNTDPPKHPPRKRRAAPPPSRPTHRSKRTKKHHKKGKLWDRLKATQRHLPDADDGTLLCLTLRIDADGTIRLCHNNRPIGIIDAEHKCCKIYLAAIRKSSSRHSDRPTCQYNATHPAKPRDDYEEIPFLKVGLDRLFQGIIDGYRTLSHTRDMNTPKQFQHPREMAASTH